MTVCHAYNMQGQKCDLTYEHDDDHEFTIRWTNDDNWTPNAYRELTLQMAAPLIPLPADEPLDAVPVYNTGRPGTCVMCEHAMHSAECARCDCRSGIPA